MLKLYKPEKYTNFGWYLKHNKTVIFTGSYNCLFNFLKTLYAVGVPLHISKITLSKTPHALLQMTCDFEIYEIKQEPL